MNDIPLLSIIIPTYNRNISVIDQLSLISTKKLEVLVIDDGSTLEFTAAVKKSLSSLRVRYKYLSLSHNNGAGYCRNIGIKYAVGKYLMFIDSDDTLTDFSIPNILSHLAFSPSDIDIFLITVSLRRRCGTGASLD